MGVFYNTRSSDPRPDHIKNAKKMEELDKSLGDEGQKMIARAQELKERYQKEDSLRDYGKEGIGCIIDGETYYEGDEEKLEKNLKLQEKVSKKEAGSGSLWIDEKAAKKIGLSEPEIIDEKKFELGAGISLAELREDKKQERLHGWKKMVKKLELEMDFELKFHPERIKFVKDY